MGATHDVYPTSLDKQHTQRRALGPDHTTWLEPFDNAAYRWLGHILRMPNNRFIKEAVKVQFYMKSPGNMFMDAPKQMTFDELVVLAADRKNEKKAGRV